MCGFDQAEKLTISINLLSQRYDVVVRGGTQKGDVGTSSGDTDITLECV